MLRSNLRKSKNKYKIHFDIGNKLEDCIERLTPFFNRTNLKFSYFSTDWPIMVLGADKDDQQLAIDTFLKRFHLKSDFLPHKLILKYLKNEIVINDDSFQNICELNRKFKSFKFDQQLVAYLLDNSNSNSVEAGNLETLTDSFELLAVENYVTNEFLGGYLTCRKSINIKTFLLIIKIAEKTRVVREIFKKFGTLQEMLLTSEYIDVDLNRNLIELFLNEIVCRSNYLKSSLTVDDPFYDSNLVKNDYKLILSLILNKKLAKGRVKMVLNELKYAQLSTMNLHEKTFAYLLQLQNLKINEGNLKKIKLYCSNQMSGRISLIKTEEMGILLQLDDVKFNIKRVLNCDKNSYNNKSVDF